MGGTGIENLLKAVRDTAERAGVFGDIAIKDGRLTCRAKASAAPAAYRVEVDGGRVWASLVMADRWLSESIESDLMHTGDKMEDLLEEELIEQSLEGVHLPIEHFRSGDLLFTFRSPVPIRLEEAATPVAARLAGQCLLAYEACFRNLGDMSAGVEETR